MSRSSINITIQLSRLNSLCHFFKQIIIVKPSKEYHLEELTPWRFKFIQFSDPLYCFYFPLLVCIWHLGIRKIRIKYAAGSYWLFLSNSNKKSWNTDLKDGNSGNRKEIKSWNSHSACIVCFWPHLLQELAMTIAISKPGLSQADQEMQEGEQSLLWEWVHLGSMCWIKAP